ncbi:hypothetical protein ABT300_18775 [Streptomyces sp. NPDC001027]|uniref:hypothetical protein n=1 Tax=Streptomyces sp. NPDC001027 TaxID=3154771 RepID=UPI00332F3B30
MTDVVFTAYGPDRFAPHLPFARHGYLFTAPGTWPDDTPAHTNVTNWEMAVYRTRGEWEVRDVDGNRRVWGTGPSRRVATGLAFQEIARRRRKEAAEIARQRVNVLGLEPIPPFTMEVTASVTLVLAPNAIGVLASTLPGTEGGPERHLVLDIDGGEPYEIVDHPTVSLHTTQVGVLHHRCDCNPENAARFESEPQALTYAKYALTQCWPCTALHPTACVHCAEQRAQPHKACTPDEPCATCAAAALEPVG